MSQFKNTSDFKLFYTDTDCIYIDKALSEDLISKTELGKFKLENTCTEAVFLSPKVYILINDDGKVIYKVKGLSLDVEITFVDFKALLNKESLLEKVQTKWIKNISEGHISLLNQLYTLRVLFAILDLFE